MITRTGSRAGRNRTRPMTNYGVKKAEKNAGERPRALSGGGLRNSWW
jgi:hypothetical protein